MEFAKDKYFLITWREDKQNKKRWVVREPCDSDDIDAIRWKIWGLVQQELRTTNPFGESSILENEEIPIYEKIQILLDTKLINIKRIDFVI